MKARYRLIRRGIRGGAFYSVDTKTGKRTSLAPPTRMRPRKSSRPRTFRAPAGSKSPNRQSLSGRDRQRPQHPHLAGRNGNADQKQAWSQPGTLAARGHGPGVCLILHHTIIDTTGELMLKVLQSGTVSTNVFLRRLHNFCLDMNWLAWPLVPKRQWPAHALQGQAGHHMGRNTARSLSARRTRNAKPFTSWPGIGGVAIGLGAPCKPRTWTGRHALSVSFG